MKPSQLDAIASLAFSSKKLGPLPIINRVCERLQLDRILEEYVPFTDRRVKLPPAKALGLLVRNVLVSREPIYGLGEWAAQYDAGVLRLPEKCLALLNDDRVGRSLDKLFRADRAGLVAALVVQAQRQFGLELEQLHNDTTTITFEGRYEFGDGRHYHGKPTRRITWGYNKDHRPDLKQLVYALTTTADGAVPVWCSVEHGNTTDDKTHIGTWDALRKLVGTSDFRYVADSKLCTIENMAHITNAGGRFITVMPRTRKEDSWFRDWMQTNEVAWEEVFRQPNSRQKDGDDEVYRAFESPQRSAEGYRVIWYYSSQKQVQDHQSRRDRMDRAFSALGRLRERMKSPRTRLTTEEKVSKEATKIIAACNAERWVEFSVTVNTEEHYKQAGPGRPSKNTQYVRQEQRKLDITFRGNEENLRYDSRTDGVFPLIVNESAENLSMRDALLAYKHQPHLERRFHGLKSINEVMPVMLHSPARIEAFLFVYFMAIFVDALIEREIRNEMECQGIQSLPLYGEGRACSAPTTDRIFTLFADTRRHVLIGPSGEVLRQLHDDLSPTQRKVLKLLGISTSKYFGDGAPRAS